MSDETYKKLALVFIAIGLPTVGYLVFRALVFADAREGSLPAGSTPVTVVSTSPTGPCRAVPQWAFHLRPQMQLGTAGSRNYPVGTELQILEHPAGALTRRGASMYKVKVLRDEREGFVFLYPSEIVGDCRPA